MVFFYVNNAALVLEEGGREGREEEREKEEELREREQRKGVKSSRSRSRCFGEKDIKEEGRSCGGGNVDGGSGGRRTEIAAIWAGGTLDKKNVEENCSSGLRFTNNIMSQ